MSNWTGLDLSDSVAERLLDLSPDMAYVLDADGRFRWWNDRVPAVTGYSDAELEGRSAFDLVPEDEHDRLAAALDGVVDFDRDRAIEFDVLTKDGDRLPHEFRGGVVLDDEGDVVAMTGIARCVGERRRREARLRRHRDELDTLYRIGEAVEGVIRAMVDAGTRDGIETVVCETLAASDLYTGVWFGRRDGGPSVEPSTVVGPVEEFVAVVNEYAETADWRRPAARVHRATEPVVVQNIPAPETDLPDEVKAAAGRLDVHAGTSVPVRYRETAYGVVTVYSDRPNAFSERELEAFRRLGDVIGFAINAVQTERLLLSESLVELEFEVTDRDALLTRLTAERGGTCRLEWATPTDDGGVRTFYAVAGLDPDAIASAVAATDDVSGFRVVSSDGDEAVVELTYDRSAVRRLIDAGASPRTLEVSDGTTHVVAEAPSDADVRAIVEGFTAVYDDARFVAKRVVDRPVGGPGSAGAVTGATDLTERQREVLSLAHRAGYFEWPRESTAEEVASMLDVTSATFHYHLRAAQAALVDAYLRGSE